MKAFCLILQQFTIVSNSASAHSVYKVAGTYIVIAIVKAVTYRLGTTRCSRTQESEPMNVQIDELAHIRSGATVCDKCFVIPGVS